MTELTDEQCEEYRRMILSPNNLVRLIRSDGRKDGYSQALIDVLDTTKNMMQKAKRNGAN